MIGYGLRWHKTVIKSNLSCAIFTAWVKKYYFEGGGELLTVIKRLLKLKKKLLKINVRDFQSEMDSFLSFGTAKNHGLKQMKNKRFKSMNVLNWKKGPSLFLLK